MSETINTTTTSQITASIDASIVSRIPDTVNEHISNFDNPHFVTCEQIGAMPLSQNVVTDDNYIHTDNNYTDVDKNTLNSIANDYVSNSVINEIREQIDSNYNNIVTNSNTIVNLSIICDNLSNNDNLTKNSINDINTNISDINSTLNTIENNLTNKVDKIDGKGLSTEDFTTELKTKLEGLSGTSNSTPTTIKSINKNYLYNPTFTINTRASNSYEVIKGISYTVDRWIKGEYTKVSFDSNGNAVIQNTSTTVLNGIGQYIANDKNMLGKKVTITVSCDKGVYTFTTDTLPLNPSTTHVNTIINTFTTDFGAIQVEYHASHFIVNILMSPATSDNDGATMTLYFAKLEIGDTATEFEYPNEVDEKMACYQFYQPIDSNSMFYSGNCQKTSSNSAYYVPVITATPMFKNPTFVNNNTSGKIQICEQGSKAKAIAYSSITTTIKSNDYRVFNLCFNFSEDNTAVLNGETSVYVWTVIKFSNFAFDAEIYS